MYNLSEINIYPIKSLGGISLKEALIENKGLQYDRRWMLIDEEGIFITQRNHFELSLLQVSIGNGKLTVSHKIVVSQTISFFLDEHTGENITVQIWDDISHGLEVSSLVSEWFSAFMKMKVRLVVMPLAERRAVDQRYASNAEVVSFADAYPCLIISQASLDGLNLKLEAPILMDRFRPNFVFTGGTPHIEDTFSTFYLGDILFSAVKPCARCVLTTVNQQTGVRGQEPLRTLAGYRNFGNKILFGQNLVHEGSGIIRVGDQLKVASYKPKIQAPCNDFFPGRS